MPKNTAGLTIGVLALCLSHPASADPKPAPQTPRIVVTLQALTLPAGTAPISVSDTHPASELYKTLLQTPGAEAVEVSVQTPANFPGVASCSRVFTFQAQDHGKSQVSFLTVPTGLEATPHVNLDGTITVNLKVEVTSLPSATAMAVGPVPETTRQSMTATRTFVSGRMVLLDGLVLRDPKPTQPAKQMLQFVTVTVLPSAK